MAWTDRVIEAGVLCLLVFTPLAFGAAQPWSAAVAELTALALAVVWAAGMIRRKECRVELPPGWLPASLFLLLLVLQTIPLPADVVGAVAPLSAAVRRSTAEYLGTAPAGVPVSLVPYDTARQTFRLLVPILVLLVVYNTYRSRAQLHRAIWTMLGTTAIIAFVGILQRLSWTGRLYWIGPTFPRETAFGPFVNPEHFVALVIVTVPLALALILGGGAPSESTPEPRHRVRVALLLVLLGSGVLISGSRGGLVGMVAALLGMAAFAARRRAGGRRAGSLAAAMALIVLTAVWIGGDVLYSPIGHVAGDAAQGRPRIWADAVRLWQASPLLGTGLGTFGSVFPLARTQEAPVAFTHAESSWVQLLVETGAVGLGLALLAAGALGYALLERLWEGSPRTRGFALAGLIALLGTAVQGITTYSLPVTSNLAYAAVALAVTLRGGPQARRRPRSGPLAAGTMEVDRQGRTLATVSAVPRVPVETAKRVYLMLARHRACVLLAVHGGVAVVAYALGFFLRFELAWPAQYSDTFLKSLPLLVAVRLACARACAFTTLRWRFVDPREVVRLAGGASAGTLVLYVATRVLPFAPPVPRSVILIEGLLTVLLTAMLWVLYRVGFEHLRHRRSTATRRAKQVLIVGAGEAGNMLAREMRRFPAGYRPIGFVDDDRTRVGTRSQGVEVLGTTADLSRITAARRVDEIAIAVPSASAADLRRIVSRCDATGLPFKVLPGIAEVMAGDVRLSQLREVRIEDLLGRAPIELRLPHLAEDLRDQSVLITGAAGSIGAELARQVALNQPGKLVLFDQAETELFYLEMELREQQSHLPVVPVIGDITDASAVERAFREHGPSRVFHAAAYKHVPMMEANAREAVRNNVIGTWRVADAAGRHGAAKFVLVSTDKAVRPANVMGATKRVAEMVVRELHARYPNTMYAAVRFGNVLDSRGSVLPIFRRQLEAGQPLTVTHPEATRYFMTIPEAVQLILEAALLPEIRGRIAMLEMGQPVRIADLARDLLRLAGRANHDGSNVRFTGLRPGEKLHEELVAPDERTVPTSIHKVRLVETVDESGRELTRDLAEWERSLAEADNASVMARLTGLVPSLRRGTARAA